MGTATFSPHSVPIQPSYTILIELSVSWLSSLSFLKQTDLEKLAVVSAVELNYSKRALSLYLVKSQTLLLIMK